MKTLPAILGVALLAWAGSVAASGNLIRNPRFESDGKRPGIPDEWSTAGDPHSVTQTLALDEGREGRRCAKLACTRFQDGGASAHAMLCQLGVPVARGKNYRLSFWARGENLAAEMISVALKDTTTWTSCGLQDIFPIAAEWKHYESVFRATCDAGPKSRFQIAFTSTGTLWVNDVVLEQVDGEMHRPGHVIPGEGHVNLVPNASFECGTDGWGSAEAERATHWDGPMNDLFGQLDSQEKFDGHASLRIAVAPDTAPVASFDYYELVHSPVLAPLAANVGYIEVVPGRGYVFSVYMKARDADTTARLAVREFQGRSTEKLVRVSTRWQRYTLSFQPAARWCYVLAGPDLRESADNPSPSRRATLWLSALQLEQAEKPSPFGPRTPVEFGLSTDRLGNVFALDEPLWIRVALANADSGSARPVQVELGLTDFFDREVWHDTVRAEVPPGQSLSRDVLVDGSPAVRGFLRLYARMTAGELSQQRTMRLAVIPVYSAADSRFGVNHAYPWPHLLELTRKAGMTWFRDWSLKWQEVEPEKGHFTFAKTDYQIDRARDAGFHVLGLLPFPSSNWSSSAAKSVGVSQRYPESRARVAYAPRDLGEFENYVEHTVAHYRGRIAWWQVLNEPVYTDYALPRKQGNDGATYARLVQAFVRGARRGDPQCHVLAGIGGLSAGPVMEDFAEFFAAGGLRGIDAVDIHHYPCLRSPEYIEEPLQSLGRMMEKYGPRKPIWLTEFGYYGEDDPAILPPVHQGFDCPLESEQIQAAYVVRWSAIMLANGVERLFYHAGTATGIDADKLEGTFYEYAGEPRKLYAAQAVMAGLFTPDSRFVKQLSLGGGVRGYLFRDGQRLVAVVWAVGNATPREIPVAEDWLELRDIMGRRQEGPAFTPGRIPVYLTAEGASDEQFQRAVQVPAKK